MYGDPEVHPQHESYWGHVNPIGPRACYAEAKRLAETLTYAYHHQSGVEVRVARIFNTYGPRMRIDDGRVVSNFVLQCLEDRPITVYGSGDQTRSLQYVSDLVAGLVTLMESNYSLPVNIGNPEERSINTLAAIVREANKVEKKIYGNFHSMFKTWDGYFHLFFIFSTLIPSIRDMVGSSSEIVHTAAVEDDPQRRCPNISTAETVLNWGPRVSLRKGLAKTIEYFKKETQQSAQSHVNNGEIDVKIG